MTKPIYKQELALKVNQLKRLDRHLKKIQKAHLKLKTQIQLEMGNSEFVIDEEACVLCTWKHYEKEQFNEEKFKEENPNIVKQIQSWPF